MTIQECQKETKRAMEKIIKLRCFVKRVNDDGKFFGHTYKPVCTEMYAKVAVFLKEYYIPSKNYLNHLFHYLIMELKLLCARVCHTRTHTHTQFNVDETSKFNEKEREKK